MSNGSPPKWADRFLEWYCNPSLLEEIQGDAYELYNRSLKNQGRKIADMRFIWNVLRFFRWSNIKRSRNPPNLMMYGNYFKVFKRDVIRQKGYSFLNVFGLAIGIACFLLISLYIRDEYSFDRMHSKADRIYRVHEIFQSNGVGERSASLPFPVADALLNDFSGQIVKAVRLFNYQAPTLALATLDNKKEFNESRIFCADSAFFDVFDFPLLEGNAKTALSKTQTIVLTESLAKKYFGEEPAIGKYLKFQGNTDLLVTAVMKDVPLNTHFQFDALISFRTLDQLYVPAPPQRWHWHWNPCWTYILLKDPAAAPTLQAALPAFVQKYFPDFIRHDITLELFPLTDIHLRSNMDYEIQPNGTLTTIYVFASITVFVLLIACINFINLSTARAANRAKEVGLRKTAGSVRGYLITQFLTESVFYSLVSFAIALVMVWVALPYFNALAGKSLTIPWLSWWFFPSLVVAMLFIGVVAGLYPSFYLSAFKPIDVLKGSLSRGSKSSGLRSAMVVFQFTASIVLIIGTLVIYRQMNYLLTTKTGFDKDQVVILYGTHTLNNQQLTFRDELLGLADVQHVSISSYLPVGGGSREGYGFWRKGREKADLPINAQKWRVDADYISTMKMHIVEGRDFNRELASDSQAAVVNQAFVKEFGLKKPLGDQITNGHQTFTIIGVVEDFNFESMKQKIMPLSLVIEGGGNSMMTVRVKSKDMQATLGSLTKVWNKFMPHQPFRYGFLDESFARMYDDVQRMGSLFAGFATLAIIVACLGLFALSAFMVEQRSKEISIRLVLGATTQSIFRMLTQNFVKLVFISMAIATPLGWYLMQTWLADYTYKIPITWDVFVLAGGMSVFIALSTVSYQSIRAALANPAKSLRSE